MPQDDAAEQDPRPIPAEFQYLLIVAALFALLLLAGLPGREPQPAGERSNEPPRREWARRWTEQVQAEQAATAPADSATSPSR